MAGVRSEQSSLTMIRVRSLLLISLSPVLSVRQLLSSRTEFRLSTVSALIEEMYLEPSSLIGVMTTVDSPGFFLR